MNKPIIGIVCKHKKSDLNCVRPDSKIRDEVKQAIFDNGGISIGILFPDEGIKLVDGNYNFNENCIEYIKAQLELCDGIILQGGTTSEMFEMFIAKYCYDKNIPTLGICAGQNNIVRALGGTLCLVDDIKKHCQTNKEYVHNCYIDPSSKFFSIVGKEEIIVNSRHKKTVKTLQNLNAVGFCEDGHADVVEDPNKDFYIGVRFHPESLYKKDVYMNNIFVNFIEVAKKQKLAHSQENGITLKK